MVKALGVLGAGCVAAWATWLALRAFARWCVQTADSAEHQWVWAVRVGLVLVVYLVARVALNRRPAEAAEPEAEAPAAEPEPCPYGPTCVRCNGYGTRDISITEVPELAEVEPIGIAPAPQVPHRKVA